MILGTNPTKEFYTVKKTKSLKMLFILYLITVYFILFLFIKHLNIPTPIPNREEDNSTIIIGIVESLGASFLNAGVIIGILINFIISLFLLTLLFHFLFHFIIKKMNLVAIILLPFINTIIGALVFLIITSIFDFTIMWLFIAIAVAYTLTAYFMLRNFYWKYLIEN